MILAISNGIILIPKNTIDPNTPTRYIADIYPNEIFTINELINKVGI